MLAHTFKGTKKKKFEYPGHVQPKLDGVRCLAQRGPDGEICLTSRQGKPWNIPHIAEELKEWLPDGMVLDGELYVAGESCQRITSWAKSANPKGKSYKPEALALIYHVYDMPTFQGYDEQPWIEREKNLEENIQSSEHIRVVYSWGVENEDEVMDWHGRFISQGYEGAILRGLYGPYLWGYRSAQLLKIKEFQDDEFVVVGATDGKGKMEGCVVWLCETNEDAGQFEVTMKLPMSERRRMFEQQHKYLGKSLTVRFFGHTDDGIPRFPVGICFRDEIDMP
jgi:ATP-dependent DNA ligase